MRHKRFASILLVVLTFGTFLSPLILFHPAAAATLWGSPSLIENAPGLDLLSTGLQASNGTMWVAWQTNRYRGDSLYDVAYKTYTNGAWSLPKRLTSAGENTSPSMAQLPNGTIFLFWAYKSALSYLIYYEMYNPGGWSSMIQASNTALNDTNPSAAVGRDGTLWLTWTRTDSTCGTCIDPPKQVYYKTLKAGSWSAETRMTSDTNQNWGSNVMIGKDSITRIAWSKGLGSLENYQIYYKTYNGTVGSAETKVVTSTSADDHPSLMQDRNGTMWLFWSRKIYYTSQLFYFVIFGKYSSDGGNTWSAETQLTNTSTSIDSMMPFAVQSSYNKSIWLFYTTDPVADDDIYALISNPIQPIHDVTIKNVTSSVLLQYTGGLASIGQSALVPLTVTVLNLGDQSEVVTAALTISNSTSYNLGTKRNLAVSGGTVNLVFTWNTTGLMPGWYSVSAIVSPVAGETVQNQADNAYKGNNVMRILPLGDIDQNGSVTLTDVSIFFYDFGFTPANPNRWNPLCDINNNGIIDIIDTGIAVRNFGIVS